METYTTETQSKAKEFIEKLLFDTEIEKLQTGITEKEFETLHQKLQLNPYYKLITHDIYFVERDFIVKHLTKVYELYKEIIELVTIRPVDALYDDLRGCFDGYHFDLYIDQDKADFQSIDIKMVDIVTIIGTMIGERYLGVQTYTDRVVGFAEVVYKKGYHDGEIQVSTLLECMYPKPKLNKCTN